MGVTMNLTDIETEPKSRDVIFLDEGDSALIFRANEEHRAFINNLDTEEGKATRYAIAFCLYALNSTLFREIFEREMFDNPLS